MNRDNRGWLLACMVAATSIFLCVCIIQGVALVEKDAACDAEIERVEKACNAKVQAAIDTPYADGAWYQQRIHQLELENGALREQIAILTGEVSFTDEP